MLKKNILLTVSLIVFSLQSTIAAWQPTVVNRIGSQSTACNAFAISNTVRSFDVDFQAYVYPNPSNYVDNTVVNRVVLGINRDCTGTFTGFTANVPYDLEVDILVEYLDYTQATTWITDGGTIGGSCGGAVCAKTSALRTLKVKYDPTYQTTEIELSFFEFYTNNLWRSYLPYCPK